MADREISKPRARIYLAVCRESIVERLLRRAGSAEGQLPYGVEGEFQPDGLFGCDVAYDTLEDIPEEMRDQKGTRPRRQHQGAMNKYTEVSEGAPIDILIHCVAFSPEIKILTSKQVEKHIFWRSRSVYSLIGLSRAALPLMKTERLRSSV